MMEKLKLNLKTDKFYFYLLALIISFLLILWFKDGKIIASGEDGLFLLNAEKSLIIFDNLWIENGTGFSTTDFLPRLPFSYFINALSFLGFPPFLIQAVVFFILMYTGCFFFFKLVYYLNKTSSYVRELSFFSAFFYLFNPFSLTQIWNRQLYSQYFLFALLPLILYLYIKGIEEKKYQNIIYIAFASLIFSTAFGLITNVLVLWSVIAIYSFYYFFTNKQKLFAIFYFLLNILVWGLANLWWIAPFYINLQSDSLFTSKINPFENLNTLRALSNYFDIYNVSRLLQENYFFRNLELKDFYSNYYLQIFSYLAPVLILINSLSIYLDKRLRFFTILFVIGLFVSLGSNFPFGAIFEFFFTKITFLQSFRNPYEKFGIVYVVGYVVLLSYSLLFLLKNKKSKIFLTCFILLWLYYLNPLIYGNRLDSNKVSSPFYLKSFNVKLDELVDERKHQRITALPLTGEGISTNWGYSGVEPSVYLYNFPFVSYRINTPIQLDYLNKLNEKILSGNTFELQLSLINSKHVLLKNDLVGEENFNESSITQKKVLDFSKVEEIKCDKVEFEKNMIEGKKVIACNLKNYVINDSFLIKIESPINVSPVEVNLIDNMGNRNIWRDPEQVNNPNLTTTYLINSDKATEKSKNFNYSKLLNIYLVVNKNIDVESLNLYTFYFYKTPVKFEKNENSFQKLYSFKEGSLYELTEFNEPNQIGYISSVTTVEGLSEIFSLGKISEELSSTSIIAKNQNKGKFFDANQFFYLNENVVSKKISPAKYWIENNPSKNNLQNIQLLNTFNSSWVILKDISLTDLDGGFLNTYNLIQKSQSNKLNFNHLISNGFANFWQIKNNEDHKGYAVIFLPQLYKDFGIYISGLFYVILLLILILLNLTKFFKSLKKL